MREYFSHDYNARNDKKLIRLNMKHGLSGIGAYWCIVEMLYEEGGYLATSEYERIAFELRTENDLIKNVIKSFDLFIIENDIFHSETALDRINKRNEKSQKARESVEKRWNKYERNTDVKQPQNDGNTIKVNKSKLKESKLKEKELSLFNEFRELYQGSKRGNETEFKDFQKHKDYKTILPTLKTIIDNQINSRANKKTLNEFVPEWKNLKTWLNNRCWEEETVSTQSAISGKKEKTKWKDCTHRWKWSGAVAKEGLKEDYEKDVRFYKGSGLEIELTLLNR